MCRTSFLSLPLADGGVEGCSLDVLPGTREGEGRGRRDLLKVPRDPPGMPCAQDRSWQAPSQPGGSSTLLRRLSAFARAHAAAPRVVQSPTGPWAHPAEGASSTRSVGREGTQLLSSLSRSTVALGGCGPDTCRREVSTSARAAGQVHYGTALLGRPAATRPHGRLRKSCPPRRCQNDPPRPPESSCCCRQEAPLEGPGVPKDPVLRGYPHSEGKRWVAILRVGWA